MVLLTAVERHPAYMLSQLVEQDTACSNPQDL